MNNRLRPGKWVMLAYLLPGFLVTVGMLILPLLTATGFSFCKFTSIKNITFVGLDNYRTLFADKNVLQSLENNLFLVGVSLVGQLGIAFILAMILNSRLTSLKRFHRTVAYFPVTLSAVVVGYVWSMVFDYNFGLLGSLLKALGCGDQVVPWLSQPSTVMICVCIPLVWQYIGFHLVIMLSAMSSIDKEIYEMAELDGAGEFRRAVSITLPLIRNTLMVCVFLCISANMKVFDHIIAMTNGGPGYSSSVMAVYTYIISFNNMNFGYGSALSVAIFVVTATLVAVSQLLFYRRKEA